MSKAKNFWNRMAKSYDKQVEKKDAINESKSGYVDFLKSL